MGSIDASVITPRQFKTLTSSEGSVVEAPEMMKKDADELLSRIAQYLTEHEMEPLAMIGLFDLESQADMILWEN